MQVQRRVQMAVNIMNWDTKRIEIFCKGCSLLGRNDFTCGYRVMTNKCPRQDGKRGTEYIKNCERKKSV